MSAYKVSEINTFHLLRIIMHALAGILSVLIASQFLAESSDVLLNEK